MLTSMATLLGRRYPLFSACGAIANSSLFRLMARGAEVQSVSLHRRLPRGVRLFVDPQDFVGRAVFFFGDLDPKLSWLIGALLRPGDAVVDVGANHGLVSVLAAALVGEQGAVHAVEPQPRLAALLRRSATLNGYRNLIVHELALGAVDAELELFVPTDNGGAASLVRQHAVGRTITVPVRASGDFMSGLKLASVRLLKLDVEGVEGEVLRGAVDFIRQTPVEFVLFEHNPPSGEQAAGSVEVLRGLGYQIYALPRRLMEPRLVPVGSGPAQAIDGANDLVAVLPGSMEAALRTRLHLS